MTDLPQNWIEKTFEKLIKDVIGGDWGSEQPTTQNTECVAVIRGTDYKNWDTCRAKNSAIRYIKSSSLLKRNLSIGDIVLEVSGGGPTQPVARTIVIDELAKESNNHNLVCSNFFRKISIIDKVCAFYVNYYCKYAYKQGYFNEYQTQTTNLRNLNFNDFINNIQVPLPPLNEQKRIVKKLDSIMPKIDEVNERLEKIPLILKRARQSILNQAITGELTKDWRKKNNKQFSSKTVKLSDVCELLNGYAYKSNTYVTDSNNLVIRLGNVKNNKILLDAKPVFIPNNIATETERFKIQENDILITLTGTRYKRDYLYSTLVTAKDLAENNLYLNQRVGCFRAKEGFLPQYLNILIKTQNFLDTAFELETGNVNQGNIGTTNLKDIEIDIPDIEEQTEIIQLVNASFAKLDKIEEQYKKAKSYTDRITQSILHKAFKGDLVPQDPNDKPINLENIKTQNIYEKEKALKKTKVDEIMKEIVEILKEFPEGISPEELFKKSKYSQKDFTDEHIIAFYNDLSKLLDSNLIEEDKDINNHKILIKKVML